jgi:NADH-quinone oxidoreductase subunit H
MNSLTNAQLIANDPGWLIAVKALLTFVVLVVFTLLAIWWERRFIGFMQERPGPNRHWPTRLIAIFGRWRKAGT